MSRLENFINENREAFDDKVPSAKVWEKVAAAVNEGKSKKIVQFPLIKWSMAAAAVLLIGLSITWFATRNKKTGTELADTQIHADSIVRADAPEVNQFTQMIAVKQEELKVMAKEQPDLYRRFTTDINQLDSSYLLLKKQFSITPNREMLVEAMIQNLQLQLNVLNQQLNIIHQIKQSKKYSHEKNDQII
jgi:hypothetical protein